MKQAPSIDEFKKVTFYDDQIVALPEADALIIMTEWKAFQSPNFDHIKTLLKQPLIFDGCNMYEPALMQEYGFRYHGVGQPGARK